jgi:rhodanese-related sulfurtransferase
MIRIMAWLLALAIGATTPAFATGVPVMDKDQLQAQLGSAKLVVLDVRQGRDWSTSEYKIKGAIRVEGGDLSVADAYPKDTTLVLYCA